MPRIALTVLALLALADCAAPFPPPDPTIADPPPWNSTRLRPVRSGTDCAEVIARVRTHPDSLRLQPPVLVKFSVPPTDSPRGLEGHSILYRVLVDEAGRVVADSTQFNIRIRDRRYESELRAAIATFGYVPALYEGCAVPGHAVGQIVVSGNSTYTRLP